MILTLGHTKGGVGKSTLALNIAIERARAGADVLLVDGDARQTSISKAVGIRAESGVAPHIPCVVLEDARGLRQQIGLLKNKYQDIVIDVGGKDSNSLRAALTVTDVLLLPISPESVEIWAIDDIVALIDEAKSIHAFDVLALLNRAKNKGRDDDEARAIIREYECMQLLTPSIGNRSSFSSAFGRGLSVAEHRPLNRKAVSELAELMETLFGRSTSA